jgi:hypothetical protein
MVSFGGAARAAQTHHFDLTIDDDAVRKPCQSHSNIRSRTTEFLNAGRQWCQRHCKPDTSFLRPDWVGRSWRARTHTTIIFIIIIIIKIRAPAIGCGIRSF